MVVMVMVVMMVRDSSECGTGKHNQQQSSSDEPFHGPNCSTSFRLLCAKIPSASRQERPHRRERRGAPERKLKLR
jgi:hypothetical protein